MSFVFLFRFSLIFVCLGYLVLVIFSWYCCNFLLQGELIMISNFSPRRFVKLSDMGIFKWKHLATLLWSASSSSVNSLKKGLWEPYRKLFHYPYFLLLVKKEISCYSQGTSTGKAQKYPFSWSISNLKLFPA